LALLLGLLLDVTTVDGFKVAVAEQAGGHSLSSDLVRWNRVLGGFTAAMV
jgi:hypothetical protein